MATSTKSAINESYPFFLHYAENPGAILVAQQLINDNYPSWAKSMQRALGVKSKLGFIDGSLTLTPTMAKFQCLFKLGPSAIIWLSWILNCVSPKILASVVYKNTALEVWTNLKNRVSQKDGPRLFQLQKKLAMISQGDLFVTNHFTQLNVLDEIENYRALPCCTCGSCACSINEKLTQYQLQDLVMQFLMGLNESYSQIQGQILLIDPLPSINMVYSMLIQDES